MRGADRRPVTTTGEAAPRSALRRALFILVPSPNLCMDVCSGATAEGRTDRERGGAILPIEVQFPINDFIKLLQKQQQHI